MSASPFITRAHAQLCYIKERHCIYTYTNNLKVKNIVAFEQVSHLSKMYIYMIYRNCNNIRITIELEIKTLTLGLTHTSHIL
jgi:hypothetical protein